MEEIIYAYSQQSDVNQREREGQRKARRRNGSSKKKVANRTVGVYPDRPALWRGVDAIWSRGVFRTFFGDSASDEVLDVLRSKFGRAERVYRGPSGNELRLKAGIETLFSSQFKMAWLLSSKLCIILGPRLGLGGSSG